MGELHGGGGGGGGDNDGVTVPVVVVAAAAAAGAARGRCGGKLQTAMMVVGAGREGMKGYSPVPNQG